MDTIRWSHEYAYKEIEGQGRQHWKGPFHFITEATVTDSWPNKLKVKYRMGVWIDASVSEEVEPVLRKIGLSAARIEGIVGMNGGYKKWTCKKLQGEERISEGMRTKLFALRTDAPVKPFRTELQKGANHFDLDIEVNFKLGGTPQERFTLLLDPVFPSPVPRPGSTNSNAVLSVVRPPNLALQICLSSPNRIHYVWSEEEKLAAASTYLDILVNSADDIPTSRASFRAVTDDSDDEEDTERYEAIKGSEGGDRESSESPAGESGNKRRRTERRRTEGRNPLVNRYLAVSKRIPQRRTPLTL